MNLYFINKPEGLKKFSPSGLMNCIFINVCGSGLYDTVL